MSTGSKSYGQQRLRVRMDGSAPKSEKKLEETLEEQLKNKVKKRSNNSSSYEKYKQSLHAFFDGAEPLPAKVQEMLETRSEDESGDTSGKASDKAGAAPKGRVRKKKPASPKSTRQRATGDACTSLAGLLAGIRSANSPRESEAAIDALLAQKHTLPIEADILSKALSHSNEDVLETALEGLLKLSEKEALPGGRLLLTRIDNVSLLASSSSLRDLCEQVKSKVAK